MELIEAIKSRRSIRGFKTTPVPADVLSQVLDLARLSPSGMNIQPWEFIVLTGHSLQKANRVNMEQVASGGKVSTDVVGYQITSDPYRKRQGTLGKELFRVMDIQRDDAQKRKEWTFKGIRFHDAPAGILVCLDENIYSRESPLPLVDVGLITQTLALAALEFGLGTCIEGAPVYYSSALKQALDISPSKRLILGIAIGYPDWDYPANHIRSDREPLDSLVTWKS